MSCGLDVLTGVGQGVLTVVHWKGFVDAMGTQS